MLMTEKMKTPGSSQRDKKAVEYEDDSCGDANCSWCNNKADHV